MEIGPALSRASEASLPRRDFFPSPEAVELGIYPWGFYQRLEIKPGTTLHIAHLESAQNAELRVVFQGGSALDPIGKAGLSHCAEHSVFAQIRNSCEFYPEALRRGLLQVNGSVSLLGTIFQASAQDVFQARRFFAVMLKEVFGQIEDSFDFEKEIRVLTAENLWRARDKRFGPYPDPYIGEARMRQVETPESLTNITREDISRYRREHYARDPVDVVLVGRITPELEAFVVSACQSRQPSPAQIPVNRTANCQHFPTPNVHHAYCDIPDCDIRILLPYFKREDSAYAAGKLIASHIAAGPDNAVTKHLRQHLGLIYTNTAYAIEGYGSPLLQVDFHAADYMNAEKAIVAFRQNVARWINQLGSASELDSLKEGYTNSLFTFPGAIADAITQARIVDDAIILPDELSNLIKEVSMSDILAAGEYLLQRQRIVVSGRNEMPDGMLTRLRGLLGDWNRL